MFADPEGYMPEWLKWTIGGLVLVGSIALTIATGGAAALATPALAGAILGLASGIELKEDGLSWNHEKAANGFMLGAIFGAVSGGFGTLLSSGAHIASSSLLYKSIMSGVDGILGLGNYLSQNAMNGTMSDVSAGGVIISIIGGAFDFGNISSKFLANIWGPTMATELAWVYDLIYSSKKRKKEIH